MELGKVATFSGEEGKPKSVQITEAHIDALLAHAGNRALPIHETHEWFDAQGSANADSVERAARIGSLKAFRKDGEGNLIADAYLNLAKSESQALLFGAEHNPEDNCFSVVFSYDKSDPLCIPQNFRAADIVPQGAATTALFSEADSTQTSKTMTLDDIKQVLSTPEGEAYLNGILKAHAKMKSDSDADEVAKNEEAAAEMESASGVTDGDKKDEDAPKPALMRACIRVGRMIARKSAELEAKTKELATQKEALLSEVKTTAKAEATALLGKGGFQIQGGGKSAENDPETFIAARLSEKKSPNRAHAIATMARERADLYAAHLSK